ncbi:MAG TPA: carbon starvation protein A, partial [Ramlibacter sp.]
RGAYAWVTIVPTIWLLICTLVAGWEKIFDANVKVGFVSHAHKFQAAIDAGQVLAPAKSLAQMQRIVFNDYVDASLCGLFMFVVVAVLFYGLRTVMAARAAGKPTAKETPFVTAPAAAQVQ